MSDTECSKCHQPLQLGDGLEWGVEEAEILCWSCQQDEIHRLRSLLSDGEKSFGDYWQRLYKDQSGYVKVPLLPSTTALHLARGAFLAGYALGQREADIATEAVESVRSLLNMHAQTHGGPLAASCDIGQLRKALNGVLFVLLERSARVEEGPKST